MEEIITKTPLTIYRLNGRQQLVFVISLAIFILNGYVFHYIEATYFPNLEGGPFEGTESRLYVFFLACIVGPTVETWLFQVVPNQLLSKWGIRNFYVLLMVPSILFGLSHFYNSLYMIGTFFGGLILNNLYLNYRRDFTHAFLYVVLLHSLYNFYGFLFIE